MMYKIETHLHTLYSSHCGRLEEKEIVEGYRKAGYSGIVVTDHFNRSTFEIKEIDLTGNSDKVAAFLEGYYRVKEEGERQGLRVYKGAELRFDGSDNDYLLYGYPDDLLRDPEGIFRMGLAAFSRLSRVDGALLIQAHPYRKGCTPADPKYLDGVEVRNMHPDHENHNELAKQFAVRNGLMETCGSDCHKTHHIARGGILSEVLPEDDAALAALLRSGNFALIE